MKPTITHILASVPGQDIQQLIKITHHGVQSALVPTIKDACRQFALTDNGAEYVGGIEGDFNWGDFTQHIKSIQPFLPEWIVRVEVIEDYNLILVDHDEVLLNDDPTPEGCSVAPDWLVQQIVKSFNGADVRHALIDEEFGGISATVNGSPATNCGWVEDYDPPFSRK